MIRILHAVSSLGMGGGVIQSVMNLYRNIDREKVQFDFLYFKTTDKECTEEIEALGGRVFKYSRPTLKNHRKVKKELDELFEKNGKDFAAIHCHTIILSNLLFAPARKHGIKTCISHIHSTNLSYNYLKNFRNRILSFGFEKKSDYIFACSKLAAEKTCGKKKASDRKLKILYNGLNIEKFYFSEESRELHREKLNYSENNFVIGHVGYFVKIKNHSFLIDVFHDFQKQHPQARLLLIGSGTLKEDMVAKVESLGISDKVIFTGTRTDVPELYSAMDCFALPSLFEGLSIALVEAQISGLPAVMSNTLTQEGALDNCLSASLKKQAWLSALSQIINTPNAPRKAPPSAEKFKIETTARNIEDFYLSLKH